MSTKLLTAGVIIAAVLLGLVLWNNKRNEGFNKCMQQFDCNTSECIKNEKAFCNKFRK
jgi:hypothetical protein